MSVSSKYLGCFGSYVTVMSGGSSFVVVVRRGLADGLETLGEAAGVRLLGARQRLEPLGDLVEALVAGGLGEARVHLGVLVRLALDGGLQVVLGAADRHAGDGVADLGEEVEVPERVARLALGDG